MQKTSRRVLALILAACMVIGSAMTVQAKTHYVAKSDLKQTAYISQDFENLTWGVTNNTAMGAGEAGNVGGRWIRQSDDAAADKVAQLMGTANETKAMELYRDATVHKSVGVNVTKGVPAATAYEVEFQLYRLKDQGVTVTVGGKYAFIIYSAGQLCLYDNAAPGWSSVTQMTVPAETWVTLKMAVAADGSYKLTMKQTDGTVTTAADAGYISTAAEVKAAEFTCNTKGGTVAYLDNFKLQTTTRVVDTPLEEMVHMDQGFDDAAKFNNGILEGMNKVVYVYSSGKDGANWVLYPNIVTVAQRAEGDQCILVRRLAGETGEKLTGNSVTAVPASSNHSYSWSFDMKTDSGTLLTLNIGASTTVNDFEASFIVGPDYIQSVEDTSAKIKFAQGQWITVTVTVDRASKTCTFAAGDSSATITSNKIGSCDAQRFSIWGRAAQANNYCYVDNVKLTEYVPEEVRDYELVLAQNFDDTSVFYADNTANSVGTVGTLPGKWSVSGDCAVVPTTEQYAGTSGQSMPLVRGGAATLYGHMEAAPANTESYEVEFKYYRKNGIGFTGTFFNEICFHAVNDGRMLFSNGQLTYTYATGVSPVDQWVTVKLLADRSAGNYTITMLDEAGNQLFTGTAALAQGDDNRIYFNAQAAASSAPVVPYTSAYIDDVKVQLVQPRYDTLEQALSAAAAGEQVKLTADHTEQQITVPAGVTLDLNGYTLNTDALLNFGTVMDSSDGKGILKANSIVIGQCDGFALYDNAAGGYRIFAYTLNTMPARAGAEKVTFGFALEFANPDAYALMDSLDVKAKLAWDGMEGEAKAFSFSKELKEQYADMISKYPDMTVAMMLKVSGAQFLASGTQVRVTPVLETDLGTVVTGEDISYTKA